jgi:hypothetical protein
MILPDDIQVPDPFLLVRLANHRLVEVGRQVPNDSLVHRRHKDAPLPRSRMRNGPHEAINDLTNGMAFGLGRFNENWI